jgi:hypothetical protein
MLLSSSSADQSRLALLSLIASDRRGLLSRSVPSATNASQNAGSVSASVDASASTVRGRNARGRPKRRTSRKGSAASGAKLATRRAV